ncbi:hypothetical protein [Thermobrachium celere]|uniref:hypothetical protein n=1 Tax=Thermobrachium celere TaxID=53422 RepID=UPI0019441B22|nr:hypothetical protein [Thermobrachium celere]GFR34464.1 hypothetical protein TCEA9_02760 [Thermobrachium celere]
MKRSIRFFVIMLIMISSLVPLLVFALLFFNNTFSFFIASDRRNIESVLEKERKYIERFVEVNIKDVKLVATSDNVKTLKKEEIIDVFTRVMKVRDDFEKMKFIKTNGEVLEVSREGKVREYKKTHLDYFDKYALEHGDIAFYTNEEDSKQYLCFSSNFIKDGEVFATCIAYMPTDTVDFFTDNINLDAIAEIYITDSRDKFLIKKMDEDLQESADITLPIKNSDWTLVANVNNRYFKDILYKNILFKTFIFLIFIIFSIIPIANYIAIQVQEAFREVLDAIENKQKIEGKSIFFDKIYELRKLKVNINKFIVYIRKN